MGSFTMINDNLHSEELSFAEMMSAKNRSRDRQVKAVYEADCQMLELAFERAKKVLRGKSGPIARPQQFSAMSDRQTVRVDIKNERYRLAGSGSIWYSVRSKLEGHDTRLARFTNFAQRIHCQTLLGAFSQSRKQLFATDHPCITDLKITNAARYVTTHSPAK